MTKIHVTENDVLRLQSNMNILTPAGPDETSTRLHIKVALYLQATLTSLFQTSIY